MKYWKQGFYDEPVDGSVEITDEYWEELLNGQSEGLEIIEDSKGFPLLQKHVFTIEELQMEMIALINSYDTSPEVNTFFLNGEAIWLDKATRNSVENTLNKRLANGDKSASIWYLNKEFYIPIPKALEMLAKVEIYASDCYNTTRRHIANVLKLTTEEDITSYNYQSGYPTKLKFEYNEESIL